MKPENEKYKKVIDLLKNSEPVLNSSAEIEREVMRRVTSVRSFQMVVSETIDFLFRWVFIRWIRRSLVAVSFALIFIFIFQQAAILKKIDFLSRQTTIISNEKLRSAPDNIEKLMTEYRISGRRLSTKSITISEKQVRELFDSVNELQTKYKDLRNLIDGDPELKKLIEKKLLENNRKKI